jgi:hypothetical protein
MRAIDGNLCIFRYTVSMDSTLERRHPSLFRRAEDKPIHEVNDRDMRLLRHIRRHRLIASDDLAFLDGGSDQNVLRAGSGLFLFVDRETLGASNPLDVEWVSGKGERVRLMS